MSSKPEPEEMMAHITNDWWPKFSQDEYQRRYDALRNAYNMLHGDGGIIMKKLKVMRQLNLEADADINLD